nr:hypothetical transcript [Hymenolepis microstoma]
MTHCKASKSSRTSKRATRECPSACIIPVLALHEGILDFECPQFQDTVSGLITGSISRNSEFAEQSTQVVCLRGMNILGFEKGGGTTVGGQSVVVTPRRLFLPPALHSCVMPDFKFWSTPNPYQTEVWLK